MTIVSDPRPAQQGLTIEQAMAEAHARWQAGQAQHAELLCQQVLQAWPGHADALHLLGLMAHAFGNLDVAVDHVRRACQAPRPPPAYFANLAEMCRQKGLLEEAEQAGRRAVALDPTLAAGWNNLGIVLQEQGKLDESLACLERVAAMQPGDPTSLNNLGNTLKRMGRLAEARRCYESALQLAPDYAEAHSNLAFLLAELGEPDAALASARRAMEANPGLADAYINAVGAESSRRRYAEALRWVEALLAIAPLHAGAWKAKAAVLRNLDRPEEALAAARKALSAAPGDGEALCELGETLQALGRTTEALEAFEQVMSGAGPGASRAATARVALLMELGDGEAAAAAIAGALARFPAEASGWLALSDSKRFAPGDPDIERMEALLRPGGVEGRIDRTMLHFALGKAWMDAGDAERAFAHLDQGNRLHRQTFAYDADATSRWMAGLCDRYDGELYTRLAGAGAPSEAPVFVVGMPRSGTTLIEQILASHPQVHGAGELSTLSRLLEPHGGAAGLPGVLDAGLARSLGQAYLDEVAAVSGGAARVVDKMPTNFFNLGAIPLLLPGARVIHARRDPADTCVSCYGKYFAKEQHFTYDQAELGRFHRDYQALMDRWRATVPGLRLLEVDYEAVVEDLEGQARRMIDFLELPWDDACLRFEQTRRRVKTASLNQVRRPIFGSSVGRWKPYAAQLGPLLEALGTPAPP